MAVGVLVAAHGSGKQRGLDLLLAALGADVGERAAELAVLVRTPPSVISSIAVEVSESLVPAGDRTLASSIMVRK